MVSDEPVSSRDVSIKSEMINPLQKLQPEPGLALIFIAHNVSRVRHIAGRVLVLYPGRLMEVADCDSICEAPSHPSAHMRIAAVQRPDSAIVRGELPSPLAPPSGCPFRTRCARETLPLRRVARTLVACHRAHDAAPAANRRPEAGR